ncbi:MAG: MBL fold metallo-hydrolase [Acidobacteriota bacterium]
MIIHRSMHDRWLSNSWLVADREGGTGVIIDAGAPAEPLLARISELKLDISHVLLTHHHPDHVENAGLFRDRFGARVCGHAAERDLFPVIDEELKNRQFIDTGSLHVECLHVPGHTRGQLNFVVNDERVFTGDTLFAGSVGGTRGPGHGTFAELYHSIMKVLMKLPEAMTVHPGHAKETTIGREHETNPFIRAWRGLATLGEARCSAYAKTATLLVDAEDYDGGRKCWVRFDDGREDVVAGSRVERA